MFGPIQESRFGEERSAVLEACRRERFRQWRNLILIPSESICLPAAGAVQSCEFGHIYAEGYPRLVLDPDSRETAESADLFGNWQIRLADHRYYKGCLEANVVESLAQRYVAEVFAGLAGSPPANEIHVNVQALSGAAANLAVYEALVEPGGTLMGLSLSHGGHLTHGSPLNVSGRRYRIVSYEIDPQTRRLDYERIIALAEEHRPRLIIGGSSSYPWDWDWSALRRAADTCGAILLADVAHLAGMITAGVRGNPLQYADVVTFTTHKTMCGPRGAVIVSKCREHARAIDSAVFPGLQGGPHMNKIAAIARLFEIVQQNRTAWRAFQQRVVSNTAALARCLEQRGFRLEYGGTDTHLLLVDLKPFPTPGDPDVPVDGEIAGRLLEVAGVVVNKNVLPGDESAGAASGIRLGMPWLTQRGIDAAGIERLADVIHTVLSQVHTTRVWVSAGAERCRGRIDPAVLEGARAEVDQIVDRLAYPPRPEAPKPRKAPVSSERLERLVVLGLRGPNVQSGLQQVMTCNLAGLAVGGVRGGLILNGGGEVISPALARRFERQGRYQHWALAVPADRGEQVAGWLRALSDGYVLFDPQDLYAKVDGPVAVQEASGQEAQGFDPAAMPAGQVESASGEVVDRSKPFFIGQRAIYAQAPPPAKRTYEYRPEQLPVRKTVLNEVHRDSGARMVEFAGWEMPVYYPTGIFAEHRAVRTAAGLFDVSHMSVFEIAGRNAASFCETVLANAVSRLVPGMANYNYLLYPDGTAADDTFLYRLDWDRFLLVVNAANAERDWDWLSAVNSGEVVIDEAMPGKQVEGPVQLRDLRDAGPDSRVDLAIQGPASLEIVSKLLSADEAESLGRCAPNHFVEVRLCGSPAIAARTGYTGERMGFELFVHPDAAVPVWRELLNAGQDDGLLPAGLGARDSTRTEAGFPLFGHELEGEQGGTLTEAGYGFVPRFHVPFFIGREPYIRRVRPRRRKLVRLAGQGRRSLRPGHVILGPGGEAAGVVTSFAYLDETFRFVVLAYVAVELDSTPGRRIMGARVQKMEAGEVVDASKLVELTALGRFPDNAERDEWRRRYRRKG